MTLDTTATHWRQAGRDYGWPRAPGVVLVDLWAPHGQEMPTDWLDRFLTPEPPELRAERHGAARRRATNAPRGNA